MQHGVEVAARKDALQRRSVLERRLHELRFGGHRGAMTGHQEVQHGDRVPGLEQGFSGGGADVSGSAGYEDVHQWLALMRPRLSSAGPRA